MGGPSTHIPGGRSGASRGVDYFSTLGYQPGIAFLAAGFLSPVATLVLILVTLLGALPVYRRVAQYSPHGQGSIALLEQILPGWRGKALVLGLLGFAATDFIITMTLSAADATAHIVENPFVPPWTHHRVGVTLLLLGVLGAIFLKRFREAVGIAVFLAALYLGLNFVVVAVGFSVILDRPQAVLDWQVRLFQQYEDPWRMLAAAVILFPKLALGLSGFETGVAVMPLVRGNPADTREQPEGRIHNTRKLLLCAAAIMSVFLMGSSIVTSFLIEPAMFQPGGEANGRALAYLGDHYLGEGFGTLYDLSTISILWFAGASALAGLLNLVPQYLPRYGMGREWARLRVSGVCVGRHRILRASSPAIPNALAALLIRISKLTGRLSHAYFGWTEGDPIGYIFRFLFLGEGDVAPVTREIPRKAIADPDKRPFIHVGRSALAFGGACPRPGDGFTSARLAGQPFHATRSARGQRGAGQRGAQTAPSTDVYNRGPETNSGSRPVGSFAGSPST